ncbi:Carbohydrate binding domain containing protein [Histomonas meleagridis]|uniref:Carbohydrate binding domain containing protein n=1 Tax=Histomonas meleagridis TaxID=135588 RepID=UPI00355A8B5A|nr:Carbohydrate binding domain containing protein [Histomonas meleagridis]KAH0804446.1 Carbohydrate binding domain containing protein [Histomonas meleagridis]
MALLEPTKSPTAWKATHENSDIGPTRFSADGSAIAFGCFNGNIYVRSTKDSHLMYRIQAVRTESPITSIKWHLTIPGAIICSSASGFISCWHVETGQLLWEIHEENNCVNSIDESPDGTSFVSCGSNCNINLYDLSTKQHKSTLSLKRYSQGRVSGHTSRVFSSIFSDNNNYVISSGWDDNVIIWDIRTSEAVRSFVGPHICGESLALTGNTILTGSCRAEDQLQFWDFRSGKCMKSITISEEGRSLLVYGLSLTPNKRYVAVCGGDLNCVSFFNMCDYSLRARTESFDACVSSVHFSRDKYGFGLTNSIGYVDKMRF